jgi:hypothetical protein
MAAASLGQPIDRLSGRDECRHGSCERHAMEDGSIAHVDGLEFAPQ